VRTKKKRIGRSVGKGEDKAQEEKRAKIMGEDVSGRAVIYKPKRDGVDS